MMLYVVKTCGPTLCGAVAIFDCEERATQYATDKNKDVAFSKTATKDQNGISKAWLMGDGKYWVDPVHSDTLDSFIFKWE
jgi:hypothetical protein